MSRAFCGAIREREGRWREREEGIEKESVGEKGSLRRKKYEGGRNISENEYEP